MTDSITLFALQYCETALWSSVGDDSDSVTDDHAILDIDADTLKAMALVADTFAADNADDLESHPDGTMGAHDLWLTRNGHGCGFWDGDWPEPQASRLTDAANKLGHCDLYVGDDGKIYIL